MVLNTDFGQLKSGMVAVLGVPSDHNSSFLRGSALAPPRIRQALHSPSTNMCAENEHDLSAEPRLRDLGDLEFDGEPSVFEQIEQTAAGLLARGVRVLSLGGDHAITYPIVRAHAKAYRGLNILQLDAHPDLYDVLEGNRHSHACPFARIMEEQLAVRLVQIGIRTMNPHQRAQAGRFGVEAITVQDHDAAAHVEFDGPVYVSLDMDVLDPAYAPGVSHHEPGGLSTRDVLGVIQRLRAPVVGADIVELNPSRDPLGITSMAAAKFLKEIAVRMLET